MRRGWNTAGLRQGPPEGRWRPRASIITGLGRRRRPATPAGGGDMAARARWYLTRVALPVLLAAGAAAGVGVFVAARGRPAGTAQAAGPDARGGHDAVTVKT